MKNKYFCLLLLCLNSVLLSQQAGWFWQNPLPQGNDINSMHFINHNTGFVTGFAGTVLRTTNGGVNWSNVLTPMYRNNYDVSFVNDLTGFIAGKGLIKTTDGGNSWHQLMDIDFFFSSLSFIDANTGFCAGYTGSVGVIYKTTNGGSNFQVYNIPSMLNSIQMIDINTGYCTGLNSVFKTTNSGAVWSSLGTINTSNATNLTFINNNTGYVSCSNGDICKTVNGGINWSVLNITTSRLNCVSFFDANTGLAAGNDGVISKTTNSGLNWHTVFSGITDHFLAVSFIDIQTYAAIGQNGIIYKTTNSGLNWSKINSGLTFREINSGDFLNQNTGYFFASGELIKTTNQGVTWSVTPIDSTSGMSGGYIGNNGSVYVFGFNFVKRSTNGGMNFSNIFSISNYQIYCAYFLNSNTGYLGASDNKIFKTTDAGSTWDQRSPLYTNNAYSIKDLLFVNDSMGFACGSGGWVNRTTNYGKVWYSEYLQFVQTNNDLFFLNSRTGFMANSSLIHKTTNSGVNWIRYDLPFAGPLSSVSFTDSATGYVCAYSGKIYKSTNGGANWFELNSGCSQLLYSVKFVNPNTGFVFGRNGTIMKTTDAGSSITEALPVSQSVPSNYQLFQNYPNPFNPVTNIKFQIPVGNGRDRWVKLIVFDLLGKEIITLVNQQMQPGSYNVDWDASNFPSGVYFYKIEAGDFLESKKMVLVK